jgi:DNA-binding transcriptional ArsR family regulator
MLEKLLIDKEQIKKNLGNLVEKSLKIFRIEKETGKIRFEDFGALTDQGKICSALIARYFANILEIAPENSMSISDISEEIGRPMTTLSGELKKLKEKGYVEKLTTRKYRIVYHRISEILDEILSSISKNKK